MRDIKLAELNTIGGGCPFLDAFGPNSTVVVVMPNGHPGGMGFVPPMPPMPPMMCPPPVMCPPPCGPECFPPAP
jgi:hypothetical protein